MYPLRQNYHHQPPEETNAEDHHRPKSTSKSKRPGDKRKAHGEGEKLQWKPCCQLLKHKPDTKTGDRETRNLQKGREGHHRCPKLERMDVSGSEEHRLLAAKEESACIWLDCTLCNTPTFKSLWSVRFFLCIWEKSFMFTKVAFI